MALVGFNSGTSARQAMVINSNVVGGSVKGSRSDIGGLVGINEANTIIINSYANVNVEGILWTGGLVGTNRGRITNSYATGMVDGKGRGQTIGGLVGESGRNGGEAIIENCYALGAVSSDGGNAEIGVGGLVGYVHFVSKVSNSYATGNVDVKGSTALSNHFGGLIGRDNNSTLTVENSYWNRVTSGQTMSRGGTSKTTDELQGPTTATGIYASWSNGDWDFGNAMSYPALRYNEIDGVDACDLDPNTALPRCGALLPRPAWPC